MQREQIALVAGGREGLGTSVAASLLAIVCASEGARVLLVDGNEGAGGLHRLFGFHPSLYVDALRNPDINPSDVIVSITESLALAPCKAAHDGDPGAHADDRLVPLERLLATPEFDFVVIDGGAKLDNVLAATQVGVGTAVVVSDTDRVSLASSYAMLKVLAQNERHIRCNVLMNRQDEVTARAATGRLSEASLRFLDRDVSSAGSLPDDACLRAALGAGMSIGDAAEGSPAARAMLLFAERVLPTFASRTPANASSHLSNSWS